MLKNIKVDVKVDVTDSVNKFLDMMGKASTGLAKVGQAKRDAKADMIKTQADIERTLFKQKAYHRIIHEEALYQNNMEQIVKKALQLEPSITPETINGDWIVNFFQKARHISDEEIQNLWSRLLAGEASKPGTYSRRTINALDDFDTRDAKLFQILCNFTCDINDHKTPVIFGADKGFYEKNGLGYYELIYLDSIGIIKYDSSAFNASSSFMMSELPKNFTTKYFKESITLQMKSSADNKLPIGNVIFNNLGKELFQLVQVEEVDGFIDYLSEKWQEFIPE